MDGEAGQGNREAVACVCPGYLVTFESNGERGTVSNLPATGDGKVAVLCVDGALVYADAGELTVADRSYQYLGQMVVSASDPGGQLGVVIEATTSLDLVQQIGAESAVHKNVSPSEVRRVREFNVGDYVVVLGRQWLGRVMEVTLDNLNYTIYVRAFEDRMDLLRVAMVRATGTPYQDGLFFFDLHLPSSYLAVPPLVEYHSFGLSLNLNIGASGSVCLSLLDTFDGEGPFYNESSNEEHLGTPKGARNEIIYAEDACLLTLRSMLYVLRWPPAGFEELVRDHFRRRGKFVIRACQAYLHKACTVGTLDAEGCPTEMSSDQQTCSAGFKCAVAGFLPRLFKAFTAIGAEGFEQCSTPTAAQ
ncbi:hypothetical protein QOZ80_5AG0401190 [Eleusine coracana subsp. coracana]|nr:hypothetical protein QOZ80_5AG0401190 [Eleusine coracana subsp. coracana]